MAYKSTIQITIEGGVILTKHFREITPTRELVQLIRDNVHDSIKRYNPDYRSTPDDLKINISNHTVHTFDDGEIDSNYRGEK